MPQDGQRGHEVELRSVRERVSPPVLTPYPPRQDSYRPASGRAASVEGGYAMIHVLRGRRTWLDTFPALREAGRFLNTPSPASFLALRATRMSQDGRLRKGWVCYGACITGPKFTVLVSWPRSRPGVLLIPAHPGLCSCSQGLEDAPGRAASLCAGWA